MVRKKELGKVSTQKRRGVNREMRCREGGGGWTKLQERKTTLPYFYQKKGEENKGREVPITVSMGKKDANFFMVGGVRV